MPGPQHEPGLHGPPDLRSQHALVHFDLRLRLWDISPASMVVDVAET
jgi:hypothetical protein